MEVKQEYERRLANLISINRELSDKNRKLKEENKQLKQFQNKVYSTLDEEIKYKQGILELAEEQELESSITKASFELSTLKIMRTKFKKIEDEE